MKEYSTKDEQTKLVLISSEEPNYGRMLFGVKVEINGRDVTSEFEPNWNKIFYKLDKFEFTSPNSQFCFFPFESGEILYDNQNKQKIKLGPLPRLPKYQYYRFIGNKFSANHLVVVRNYLIQMVNLQTGVINQIKAEPMEMFEWIKFVDTNTIEITINEIEKKGNTIKILRKRKTLYNNIHDDHVG